MFKSLIDEIDSMIARDPAARSRIEVIFTYPGFHAVRIHRFSHWLWGHGFRFLGRLFSHIGRFLTGVEIHPGARIGRRLFIDHGMSVVIGETSEIGDDVTLYHSVTLGGTSNGSGKRHPTLERGVIVGSGAQILGPVTVGEKARVGSNAVVLKDVPPGVTMVGVPARIVAAREESKADDFCAYGTPTANLPDPAIGAIDGLHGQLNALAERVARLEGRLSAEAEETEAESRQAGGEKSCG
ncbi:MAG: serine O-acetyltransferase [Alphaproteobacteria bacterium]|nr:serine O-acetyltransferase [Alphaproteobacteria bacterium]